MARKAQIETVVETSVFRKLVDMSGSYVRHSIKELDKNWDRMKSMCIEQDKTISDLKDNNEKLSLKVQKLETEKSEYYTKYIGQV